MLGVLELMDRAGRALGAAEKLAAHQTPGKLPRAFSVFLFAPDGRMLVQQRAQGKYHSPGVWPNACCGHPAPGEAPFVAAVGKVVAELGAAPRSPQETGTVTYQLTYEASGLVEYEFNHLFVERSPRPLDPDSEEVRATRYPPWDELEEARRKEPWSVWFDTVLDAAWPAIEKLGFVDPPSPAPVFGRRR